MSNIYITEPATNGKVIMKTTVGDIEVELWSKETPLACRNFVQLCMEGYYNDTEFHRLVKGFIVQGGDPSGTGEGGESIYKKPFKTESHSRLSFNRRGLVGMACPEPNANNSQFFFTLGEASELNGKHTLFGRVVGNTLFNMLRLGEVDILNGDRPARVHRILKTEVILNPYDDIVPRRLFPQKKKTAEDEPQPTAKAIKNLCLLSFGSEAEEEEEVSTKVVEKLRGKGKSAHDLTNDARLSSERVPISEKDSLAAATIALELASEAANRRQRREDAANLETAEERMAKEQRIKDLRAEAARIKQDIAETKRAAREREEAAAKRIASATQRQIDEMDEQKRAADWEAEQRRKVQMGLKEVKPVVDNVDDFQDEVASYRNRAKKLKARHDREAETMNLLSRFENCLSSTLKGKEAEPILLVDYAEDDETEMSDKNVNAWLKCRLISDEPTPAKAVIDANVDNPDRYDLYDPRNPLNVRKREGVASKDANTKRNRK